MYKIQKIFQTPQTHNLVKSHIKRFFVTNKEGQIYKKFADKKCLKLTSISYKLWDSHYMLIKNFSTKENPEKNDLKDVHKRRNFNRTILYGLVVLTTSITSLYVYYTKFIADEDKSSSFNEDGSKEKSKKIKIPISSDEIPDSAPYLLIGGGTASFSAFRAIKSLDPTAKILVISNEESYPYMRPPLSKEIWYNEDRQLIKTLKFKQWNGSERSLFYEPEDFYMNCKDLVNAVNGGVAVARGWDVTKIDCINKKVYLDDGKEIAYGKCLIATGARPKSLDLFENASKEIKEKITQYRTIRDFENLEDVLSNQARSVVVVGGGFLGSEISCALARYGKNKLTVQQVFTEKGNMSKVLPEYLSQWTTSKIETEGVHVTPEVEITDVQMTSNQQVQLTLNSGKTVTADHIILAVGVEPNTDLAKTSNLETDPELGGFVVNAELEARTNLYVAGDCACFYDTKLGRRRVEHHDHAVVSGRLAGENMTGARKPYVHQSMFWSDLGPDIGYEAIGIIDSKLPTVSIFAKATDMHERLVKLAAEENSNNSTENRLQQASVKVLDDEEAPQTSATAVDEKHNLVDDFSKGIIFYLKDNIVVGIVLWNLFNRMSVARQVINEHRKFEDLSEVAKLFNIYEE